ncbi:hypothetical protein SAMN05421890_4782 [Ensifer adhaerens]|nr:hypothetical protein SAMN05421890_4782 [Ensifer adhaerens]
MSSSSPLVGEDSLRDLTIPEAQRHEAICCKGLVSNSIRYILCVLAAINLDNQPRLEGNEVWYVTFKRNLAAKFYTARAAIFELIPKDCFSLRAILAH